MTLVAQGAPLVIAVLAIPLLLERLGLARFGVLSWAWVVLGYAAAFDLGVARANTKRISELLAAGQFDLLKATGATALLVNLTLGMLAGAVLAVASTGIASLLRAPPDLMLEASQSLFVVALGVPVVLAQAAARSVLEGAQRFDLVLLVAVPSSALTYVLPVGGVMWGLSLPSILLLIVVARLFALAAYIVCWRRAIPHIRVLGLPEWAAVKSLLRFGGWLTLSNATSPVVLYGERAIVGSTLSVVGLGLYVIPYELVARLSVIPGAFYAALFPAFSALSRGRPEILEETYRRALMALLMLIGPIVVGLAAFGGDVLRIWLNSGISEAGAVPLQLFAIGALMNCMAYVPLALLHGIGHPAIPAKIQAALILPTFVITWLLASTFGLPGAAAAWLCRMAADAYLLFHFAGTQRRGITISSLRQAGRGFLLTIAAAALGVASSSISAAPVRVAAASVILVGLALLFWRMVLTPADRAAILQYVTTAPLDLRGRAR